jgi:hypothetical protein
MANALGSGGLYSIHAQECTALSLKPVDEVRNAFFHFADEYGWDQLISEAMGEVIAEVISNGPFMTAMSTLLTPRYLWVESMFFAAQDSQDLEEAEREFYEVEYVDPSEAVHILVAIADRDREKLEENGLQFVVRDSAGKVYQDSDITVLLVYQDEGSVMGLPYYDVTYQLVVAGDFRETDHIELFVSAKGHEECAEHCWELE